MSGKPAPIQNPRPITLNAAFSPPGRDFAAKAADFLFTAFVDIEKGREHIDDMKQRAAAQKREIGVYTTCHVVCRPSQAEAEDYYELYASTMADTASVDHYMGQKEKFSGSHAPEAYRLHRKRFAGGAGTYPLIGTPEHIAEEMVKITRPGLPAPPSRSSISRTNCPTSSTRCCRFCARREYASKRQRIFSTVLPRA